MHTQLTSKVVFPMRPPVEQIEGVGNADANVDTSSEAVDAESVELRVGRSLETVLSADDKLAPREVFSDSVSTADVLVFAHADEVSIELRGS